MTTKITSNQEARIADLVRDAIRALGLSKDEAQRIIIHGGELQMKIKPILQKLASEDKRFGPPVAEFQLQVPADYNHDDQIGRFAKKAKGLPTTYYFNNDLTDEHFPNQTAKLIQGKAYKVKIFPILSRVLSEDCLKFLREQKAILVGAQGMTLVTELKPDKLPVGKYTVSFDKKETLWKDSEGYPRVPRVSRYSDGDFKFGLGYFGNDWNDYDCLLCFCDLD